MAEILEAQATEEAAIERQATTPVAYLVRAGVFSDVDTATTTLITLVDAGFDSALVSGESGGIVLHELQIGPFLDLQQAKFASQVLREAHNLSPSITLVEDLESEALVE